MAELKFGPTSAACLRPGTDRLLRVLLLDVIVHELLEGRRQLVVVPTQRRHVLAVDEDGAVGRFACAGQADADVCGLRFAGAVHDTAHDGERELLDAVVVRLPRRHLVADVALDPLGELLERRARRAPAAGACGHAWREGSQAERLQDLARRVDLFAAIAAGARRERYANRVAD